MIRQLIKMREQIVAAGTVFLCLICTGICFKHPLIDPMTVIPIWAVIASYAIPLLAAVVYIVWGSRKQ